MTRLSRQEPPLPMRILHLGLDDFLRAHRAWFTLRGVNEGRPVQA